MTDLVPWQPSVFAARDFAHMMHGDQDHGCLKILDHLDDVAMNVAKHYNEREVSDTLETVLKASFLHDVVEDTPVTIHEVESRFGEEVAFVVGLVTDKSGANRMERHLKTYYSIRDDMGALLVKLCDRRHNHERSIQNGEHWLTMYRDEFVYFKFALWRPHQHVKLWEELDAQYAEMKRLTQW